MVAEIDALILEVEKFRSSNSVEPVRQKILQTYVPAWQAVNTAIATIPAAGLPVGGTTGQALVKASNTNYDVAWATISAVPGGADTQVQFNDANAFGGSPFLTFDKINGHLALGNDGTFSDGVIFRIPNTIPAGAFAIGEVTGISIELADDILTTGLDYVACIFVDSQVSNTDGTSSFYLGDLTLRHTGAGDIFEFFGFHLNLVDTSSGDVDELSCIRTRCAGAGAGAITKAHGVLIRSNSGTAIVNNYGLYIQNQSGAGSILSYNLFSAGAGKNHFDGGVEVATAAQIITTTVALTDGAGAGAGTLGTAPVAGDPTKWIGINDNGVIRYVPAWNA